MMALMALIWAQSKSDMTTAGKTVLRLKNRRRKWAMTSAVPLLLIMYATGTPTCLWSVGDDLTRRTGKHTMTVRVSRDKSE